MLAVQDKVIVDEVWLGEIRLAGAVGGEVSLMGLLTANETLFDDTLPLVSVALTLIVCVPFVRVVVLIG